MRGRALLIAGCVGALAYVFLFQPLDIQFELHPNQATAGPSSLWVEGADAPYRGRPGSFADLAERLSPAVVNIQTERTGSRLGAPKDLFEEFFGRSPRPKRPRPRFRSESTGSGFVISQDGYIVTNNHVIENAERIRVLFETGTELEAEVVGRDGKTDLALLKVMKDTELPVAALGDSDRVRVGDWVMAIGNPFGLDHTVTVGILSAKGRKINAGPYDDFLQTDASINPGNSGGPLIDMNGRVVGINTAINAAGQGIGFAIPINMVKELLPQLREVGVVTRGWLGVQIQRITPALAETFDLPDARGALISQVFKNSPAEKAELERGDVILEFNGTEIETYDDLPRRVASTSPGSKVDVVIVRDGKRRTLTAVLEKMKPDEEEIELTSHKGHGFDWGFEARNLTPPISERLGLPGGTTGVVVHDVDPEGPAGRAGLRPGDAILEANKRPLDDVDDLDEALKQSDEHVVLLVQRDGSTVYLAIKRE